MSFRLVHVSVSVMICIFFLFVFYYVFGYANLWQIVFLFICPFHLFTVFYIMVKCAFGRLTENPMKQHNSAIHKIKILQEPQSLLTCMQSLFCCLTSFFIFLYYYIPTFTQLGGWERSQIMYNPLYFFWNELYPKQLSFCNLIFSR